MGFKLFLKGLRYFRVVEIFLRGVGIISEMLNFSRGLKVFFGWGGSDNFRVIKFSQMKRLLDFFRNGEFLMWGSLEVSSREMKCVANMPLASQY